MTQSDRTSLFVGRRNGAARAARKIGLPYQVVEPRNCETVAVSLAPATIIALTEASVLPAARLRERFGLPGLSIAAATRCTDKLEMKRTIAAAGLPCARFIPVSGRLDRKRLLQELGLPLVVKTRVGSGGRGATVCYSADDLPEAVTGACVAESFVAGTEMSVESFVIDGAPVFVNCTEYVEPRWVNLVPAGLDPATGADIAALNRQAIAALGIDRGITHMEVFLTATGVVFGELGARPPGGHLMRLIELAYAFDPWQALLEIEIGQRPGLPATAKRSAGVRFIHPEPGVVRAVRGLEVINGLASVQELRCKLSPGDTVTARLGTGQHHGFVVLAGAEGRVRDDLAAVREHLRIDMDRDG